MANEKRLIDANAVIDEWNKNIKHMVRDPDGKVPVDFGLVICELSKAPTVDAVEVVHGRWVAVPSSDMMTGKAYKCSECNKMRYGSFMPNYCPNCGAKMDGDGDGA